MKKIFAVLLSGFVMASAATGCAGSGSSGSTPDTPAEINEIPDEADVGELPSKFDLRDADGKSYVTAVKSQLWGDCWAFSLAGSAEIAYLYANGLGVPTGKINDKVNFSEKYIVNYMFHGVTKDDVSVGRVRASQVGEGFDPKQAEDASELSTYFIGGPFVHTANLFGSGFGPVEESVSVKGELPYEYNDDASVEWLLPLNAEYRCAPVSALFRESRILPVPSTCDAKGKYRFNEEGVTAIKTELYRGHGVSMALNVTNPNFIQKNLAVYYDGDDDADHAITVVGYDDDYPKENFVERDESGKIVKGSLPPGNGAFIIKNSWGIVDEEKDGFIYVSYYDHGICSAMSYVFDDNKTAKHTKRNIDQYDLMMTQWYGTTEYDKETKTANIFDAEEDESLYQLEYRTAFPDAEVSYEIYKDVKKDDPSSGTLLEKGVCSHKYAGSHVIDLKGEYGLKKGDLYSVVLTVRRSGAYTEVFPYSTKFFGGMSVKGIVNKGESFLYKDGKWTDMTERKDSLLESAYKQCAEGLKNNKAVPEIELDKSTFALDNYPIKAISAPKGK